MLKDDDKSAEALQHQVRQEAIIDELMQLDADVIGLNEVTATFLARLLSEERTRSAYTVSAVLDDPACQELDAVRAKRPGPKEIFGNVLLCVMASVA